MCHTPIVTEVDVRIRGRLVQVVPMKPTLRAPGPKRS